MPPCWYPTCVVTFNLWLTKCFLTSHYVSKLSSSVYYYQAFRFNTVSKPIISFFDLFISLSPLYSIFQVLLKVDTNIVLFVVFDSTSICVDDFDDYVQDIISLLNQANFHLVLLLIIKLLQGETKIGSICCCSDSYNLVRDKRSVLKTILLHDEHDSRGCRIDRM